MSTNPFIKFCHAKREEVKAANPNILFGEMGLILGSIWKGMSDSEKAVYYTDVRLVPTRRSIPRAEAEADTGLRRSSRLRNNRLGLDFWGLKLKK